MAYGSLLQERRRALHARIVEAIERLYPDRLAEHVERLAHHAFRGEVWEKAVAYLRQAGAKALARSAHREAVRFFEQALSGIEPSYPERARPWSRPSIFALIFETLCSRWSNGKRSKSICGRLKPSPENCNDQRRLASVSGYMSGLHLNTGGRAIDVRAFAERSRPSARLSAMFRFRLPAGTTTSGLAPLWRLSRNRTPLPEIN